MNEFTKIMETELIRAYTDEYGVDAWESKSDSEKSETLHSLLMSFLSVASNR